MKHPVFLLMNDMHISKDNIPEFKKNWNEAIEICKNLNIPDIVIGGDMFQSRSSQTIDVLLTVKYCLTQARINDILVTIAEGNHDRVDQESYNGYNQVFSGYKGVQVVDDYTILEVADDIDLFVMSYFPENGSFIDRYTEMLEEIMPEKKKNILYIHEGIRGGLATPSDDELPADMFKEFDSVLVGHYHNRKRIPGTNVEYIGASRQHNFGEDEEKGYTIMYSDGSYEFIKNEVNVRYKVVDVNGVASIPGYLEQIKKLKDSGMYKIKIRISCKSNEADTIDRQALIDAGVTKVELITEQSNIKLGESQSIDKKFDKSGIKKEYSAFCADRGVEDVEFGLKYLDKIR